MSSMFQKCWAYLEQITEDLGHEKVGNHWPSRAGVPNPWGADQNWSVGHLAAQQEVSCGRASEASPVFAAVTQR